MKSFFDAGKPVAAIFHGPRTLAEEGVLRGQTTILCRSLGTGNRHDQGNWVDREVVNGNGLVTSRKPEDIPAFNPKTIEEFREGRHRRKA